MQELVFEIPLSITESDFPVDLLQRARILNMLKFDASGYRFVCKTSTKEWTAYRKEKSRLQDKSKGISVRILERETKSATLLLQVSGHWFEKGQKLDPKQSKAFEFFRSMERPMVLGQAFALSAPRITENAIKFAFAAEARKINELLNGLKALNIPYKVNRLARLKAKTESVLEELTTQQTHVLRLAHTMGYYDIPRRTSTEELARILKMDKATVGEHLRRAEKHVFDKLIAE